MILKIFFKRSDQDQIIKKILILDQDHAKFDRRSFSSIIDRRSSNVWYIRPSPFGCEITHEIIGLKVSYKWNK
jgi:hypothetical protein